MPSKEELHYKYQSLTTSQLFTIIDNKFDYTELAVIVAIAELAARSPSEEEVAAYKNEQIAITRSLIKKNLFDELAFWQKNAFYFLWLPILTFAFKRNFREDGYILKVKQANYYSLCGFLAFFLNAFISILFDFNDWQSLALWIVCFVPAYFFDEYFNRKTLYDKLKRQHTLDEERL